MKIIRDFNDATKPFLFVIKPRHALHCKRRDAENCVQARAINSIPGVEACKVYRHITYILFEGDELPTRFQNSVEGTYFASLNDAGGRKAIIDEIRDEVGTHGAVKVKLNVPRLAASKAYLRSQKMKETRKESARKSKAKAVKRKYTKPHTEGMRSGSGNAHVWFRGL